MASYYTVQQGDYLSKIAKQNGFPDYTVIWNDPNNVQLKQQRQNPNVLYPGDQVYIPDKQQRQESGGTEQRHPFVVNQGTLMLRLVLEDFYEKPIANAPCALLVEGHVSQPTTDDAGKIEQQIPSDAQDAVLVIRSDETPFQDVLIPVRIGNLDPVTERSGQIERLNNLGYFAGDLPIDQDGNPGNGDGGDGGDDQQFRSAVEEFQCDHPPLKVDGDCGKRTRAMLEKVHGS